jgi:hypothetical protein
MNMNSELITAIVAVLGVIIGAALQYVFAKRREVSKQYLDLKSQAYVDFIKSVSGITQAQRQGNREKEQEFRILLTDSKARIAAYGSKEVVEAMAEFFHEFGILASQDAVTSFVNVIQKIRNEIVGESVSDKDLDVILFR